jgi:hypothetical protein
VREGIWEYRAGPKISLADPVPVATDHLPMPSRTMHYRTVRIGRTIGIAGTVVVRRTMKAPPVRVMIIVILSHCRSSE